MNNHEFITDSPIHPGEHLRETIEEIGITQTDLANKMGLSRKVLNEIVNGKAPITTQTAISLERVLKTPAHVWSNLQQNYDLNLAYLENQTQENINRVSDNTELVNSTPNQINVVSEPNGSKK